MSCTAHAISGPTRKDWPKHALCHALNTSGAMHGTFKVHTSRQRSDMTHLMLCTAHANKTAATNIHGYGDVDMSCWSRCPTKGMLTDWPGTTRLRKGSCLGSNMFADIPHIRGIQVTGLVSCNLIFQILLSLSPPLIPRICATLPLTKLAVSLPAAFCSF